MIPIRQLVQVSPEVFLGDQGYHSTKRDKNWFVRLLCPAQGLEKKGQCRVVTVGKLSQNTTSDGSKQIPDATQMNGQLDTRCQKLYMRKESIYRVVTSPYKSKRQWQQINQSETKDWPQRHPIWKTKETQDLHKHDNKLFAKLSKCKFYCLKVKYLGFLLGKDGVHLDFSQVETISNLPEPKIFKVV